MDSSISNRTSDIKKRVKEISDLVLTNEEETKDVINFFQDGDFLMTMITTNVQDEGGGGGVMQNPQGTPSGTSGTSGDSGGGDTELPPDEPPINLPPDEPNPSTSGTSGGGDEQRGIKVGDRVRIKETGQTGIVTGFNEDGTYKIGTETNSENFARGGFLESRQIRTIGSYGGDEIEIIQEEQQSGTSGTSGSPSTSGTSGTSGSQGSQGTSGTSGSQGTSGTSGSQGSQGTSGTSGSQGSQGTSGTSGSQGSQGTSGSQGSQGTSGSQGSQGSQGTSGSQGSQGTSGSQGSQGTSGSQGSQGTSGRTTSTSGTSGEGGNIEDLKSELLQRLGDIRNYTYKTNTFVKTFFNVDMTKKGEEYFEFNMMCELAILNFVFDFYRKPKNQNNISLQDAQYIINNKLYIYFNPNVFYNNVSKESIYVQELLQLIGLDENTQFLVFDTNDACIINPLIINTLVERVENLEFYLNMVKGILQNIEVIETLIEFDKDLFGIISKLCLAKSDMFDKEKFVDIHLDYVRNVLGNQTLVLPHSIYSELAFIDTKLDKDIIFNRLDNSNPLNIFVCSKIDFKNITYSFLNLMGKSIDIEPNNFFKTGYTVKFKYAFRSYLAEFYKENRFIEDYKYKKLVFENSQFLLNLQYEDKIKQFIYDLSFSTQNYGI